MRNPILLSTAITFFTLMSCSKNNSNPNASTWTLNGHTYTATVVGYDSSGNLGALVAYDAAGNSIGVSFIVRPNLNETYTVLNSNYGLGYSASTCTVSIINSPTIYLSTGKTGDVVIERIDNGKLHLTFSNISVQDGKDTTTVSGTIIQDK
jgi:hypothetical protein